EHAAEVVEQATQAAAATAAASRLPLIAAVLSGPAVLVLAGNVPGHACSNREKMWCGDRSGRMRDSLQGRAGPARKQGPCDAASREPGHAAGALPARVEPLATERRFPPAGRAAAHRRQRPPVAARR